MEENTKERICYLLAENRKLRNLNDELEQELAIKDEIIRKQICMMRRVKIQVRITKKGEQNERSIIQILHG